MKKNKKVASVILVICAVMIVLGIVFSLIGLAKGPSLAIIADTNGIKTNKSIESVSDSKTLEAFTNIHVDAAETSVYLVPGKEYGIQYKINNPYLTAVYSQEGDTLNVTVTDKRSDEPSYICFFDSKSTDDNNFITITIPEDTALQTVTFNNISQQNFTVFGRLSSPTLNYQLKGVTIQNFEISASPSPYYFYNQKLSVTNCSVQNSVIIGSYSTVFENLTGDSLVFRNSSDLTSSDMDVSAKIINSNIGTLSSESHTISGMNISNSRIREIDANVRRFESASLTVDNASIFAENSVSFSNTDVAGTLSVTSKFGDIKYVTKESEKNFNYTFNVPLNKTDDEDNESDYDDTTIYSGEYDNNYYNEEETTQVNDLHNTTIMSATGNGNTMPTITHSYTTSYNTVTTQVVTLENTITINRVMQSQTSVNANNNASKTLKFSTIEHGNINVTFGQ